MCWQSGGAGAVPSRLEHPAPCFTDCVVRRPIQQIAVGDHGAVEVPSENALNGFARGLAITRKPAQLGSRPRSAPHSQHCHHCPQRAVGARRLAAEVLHQVHGYQGSAGPVQEVDLSHDAVADEHLIHLSGPAPGRLVAYDLVESEILALALDVHGAEGPRAGEGVLSTGEVQVMAVARCNKRDHFAELFDLLSGRVVDHHRGVHAQTTVKPEHRHARSYGAAHNAQLMLLDPYEIGHVFDEEQVLDRQC